MNSRIFDPFMTRIDRMKCKAFGCSLASVALVMILGMAPVSALTSTGVAVGSTSSSSQVGSTEYKSALDVGPFDGNAIKYFIPLGNFDGTYGVGKYKCGGNGFGTCSDSGDGGGTLKMILRFDNISSTQPSTLKVIFEDLDLHGANDPWGFFEELKVQKWNGTNAVNLTTPAWITEIGDVVTGDRNTQQILELALGTLSGDPFYLILKFRADAYHHGTNTPEHLIAMITSPDPNPPGGGPQVPLPAAMILFGSVLAGSWGIGKLRRRGKRSESEGSPPIAA